MLIIGVLVPTMPNDGDHWFDLVSKATFRFDAGKNVMTTVGGWTAVFPTTAAKPTTAPHASMLNHIWIDPTSRIPHVWDRPSNDWIAAVPPGYIFPPTNPPVGIIWTDTLSLCSYMWQGKSWTLHGSSINVPTMGNTNIYSGPMPTGGGGSGQNPPSPSNPFGLPPAPPTVPMPPGAAHPPGFLNVANVSAGGNANNLLVTTPSNQSSITIPSSSSDCLLSIHGFVDIMRDGTLHYSKSYTPDAAAAQFWEAMYGYCPYIKEKKELEDLRQITKYHQELIDYAERRGFKFPKPQKSIDPNDAWDAAMGVII